MPLKMAKMPLKYPKLPSHFPYDFLIFQRFEKKKGKKGQKI